MVDVGMVRAPIPPKRGTLIYKMTQNNYQKVIRRASFVHLFLIMFCSFLDIFRILNSKPKA